MIYRILVSRLDFKKGVFYFRLGGAYMGGLPMRFNVPRKSFSRRARFYFTEKGWDLYGRDICKEAYQYAYRNGHNFRVIRRKNPHRGEVACRDDIQVALLPKRRGGK